MGKGIFSPGLNLWNAIRGKNPKPKVANMTGSMTAGPNTKVNDLSQLAQALAATFGQQGAPQQEDLAALFGGGGGSGGGGGGGGGGGIVGGAAAAYDEAMQRAQGSYDAALPRIASNYADLRTNLQGQQHAYNLAADQTAANQQASSANLQALVGSLNAPVLADLQKQGGQAAVGSLTGGLQAATAANQGNLAQQGAAQQQLSGNLKAAGQQSYDSRVADTKLAETGAASSARANLDQILNALGIQKAQAQAAEAAAASRASSSGGGGGGRSTNPLDDMLKQLKIEEKLASMEPEDTSGQDELNAWHMDISSKYPISYEYLSEVLGSSDSIGAALAQINRDTKDGYVNYGGKRLDAGALRSWANDAVRLQTKAQPKKK